MCGSYQSKAIYRNNSTKPIEIAKYKAQIQRAFQININNDIQDIHPSLICTICYRKMVHIGNGTQEPIRIDETLWKPHTRTNTCEVCEHVQLKRHGLFKRVSKRTGQNLPIPVSWLPFNISKDNIFTTSIPQYSNINKIVASTDV